MRDRRSFLMKFVYGFSAVATVGLSIPFIRSLFPSNLGEIYKDVDITGLRPGSSTTVSWLGRSVIIRARTQEESLRWSNLMSVGSLIRSRCFNSARFCVRTVAFCSSKELPGIFELHSSGCEVLLMSRGFECPCHQSTLMALVGYVAGCSEAEPRGSTIAS